VVAAGGAVTVVATAIVGGDVRGTAGAVTVEGRVRGDVRVTAPRLSLAPGARVDGALAFRGDRAPAVASGAAVLGGTTARPLLGGVPGGRFLAWETAALPRLAAMLGVGLLGVLLAPRAAVAVADGARRRPLPALLSGLGVAVFLPVALLLLATTVVGMPLAAVGASLFLGAAYASQAVVGLAIGRLVFSIGPGNASRGANLATMAVGVASLSAVRLLPVPHLNPAAALLVALLGLGALSLGLDRRLRHRSAATAEAGDVAAPPAVAAGAPAAFPGR